MCAARHKPEPLIRPGSGVTGHRSLRRRDTEPSRLGRSESHHQKMSGIIKTIEVDRKKRQETLSVTLRYSGSKSKRIMSSCVQLRTYTLRQLQNLLSKIPNFSILETYDFSYDIDQPVPLNESSEDIILILQNNG